MHHSPATATGTAVPADVEKSFAVTQATWRFLSNDRVTPQALVEPLQQFARNQLDDDEYVLAVVDWSKIDYRKHTAKTDVVQLTHEHDVGYELTTQLLVDTRAGRPIAPVQMHLKTADGYLTTALKPVPEEHRLEQITPLMRDAKKLKLSATIVHVVDREADSVFHFRQWDAAGFQFLVRADERIVRWRNEYTNYREIEARIDAEGGFRRSREVTIKGKRGVQYVAETEIVLDRPAKRKVDGRSVEVPGKAITLRLVIATVVDPVTEKVLSTWYLLTNVPSTVPAETIALWYYWRWEIESYFKLMKSGGQQLEHWQQETGSAVLKRLLVASMSSAVVWSLERNESVESEEFKSVLVRLSGKRVKRGRSPTPGVLLSGLFVLFRIFDFLDHVNYDLSQITPLKTLLANLAPGLLKNV